MKTVLQKPIVNLTSAQILLVRLYRRTKQLEKRIKDRIETLKQNILAIRAGEFIGVENDKKVCSVSLDDGRTSFDVNAFKADFPGIDLAPYTKQGDAFYTVRLH